MFKVVYSVLSEMKINEKIDIIFTNYLMKNKNMTIRIGEILSQVRNYYKSNFKFISEIIKKNSLNYSFEIICFILPVFEVY